MAVKLSPDATLFNTTIFLVSFGLVMMYSASAVVAHDAHRSSYFFLVKQAMSASVGLLLLLALTRFDYRRLRHPAFVYGLLAVTVALLVAVLVGPPVKNAHRWIRVGLLSFQPSELAKVALVVALAFQLERRRERLEDFFAGWFPSLLTMGLLAFLVVIEPDYGTAFCLVLVGACLLFVSGVPLRQLATLFLVAAPIVLWLAVSEEYRRERLLIFIDPFRDPLGKGFQIIQSLIAFGSGGILGTGFMRSQQKLFYLPEPHTDFVFAVIGEELGLLGGLAVLAAFGIILWRGLAIAHRAPDGFGSLLASGLTVLIAGQALLNIGVATGLLPTTGIPLPFVSSGGTSLVMSMGAVGLVLSVSQHAR
ncbi:MAG TPA: putative lipid II flippase FtsW [Vicinamibacteria bacterium]|nr:putative lipid II flippase FtsW [Vicinamibacteria bacterium]